MPNAIPISYASPGSLVTLAVGFLIASFTLVGMRLVGRRLQGHGIATDDILIAFALAATLAMCTVMIVAVSHGLWGYTIPPMLNAQGRPIGVRPEYYESIKLTTIMEIIFPVQLMLVKLSILFLYRRLLCPERRGWLYWLTSGTIVLVALWGTLMFLLYLFQCGSHIQLAWADPRTLAPNTCLPETLEIGMSATDSALDMWVFLLPIHRILTLNLSAKKKFMVAAVFAIGGASVVASLVRLSWYLPALLMYQGGDTISDPNRFVATLMYWTLFESGFAMVAACLPCTKIFVDLMVRKSFTKTRLAEDYNSKLLSMPATPMSTLSPPRSPWVDSPRQSDVESRPVGLGLNRSRLR